MANRAAITTNYGMCLLYLGETRGFAIIVRLTMTLELVTVAARALARAITTARTTRTSFLLPW